MTAEPQTGTPWNPDDSQTPSGLPTYGYVPPTPGPSHAYAPPLTPPQPTTPSHGHAAPGGSSYGHAEPTAPSYGRAEPAAPSYGHAEPAAPSYGHAEPGAPSFGQAQPGGLNGRAQPGASSNGYSTPDAPAYGHGEPSAVERGYAPPVAPQEGARPAVAPYAAAPQQRAPQAAAPYAAARPAPAPQAGYPAPAYPGYAQPGYPPPPYNSGYGATRSLMSTGKPPGLGWVIVGTAVIGGLGAFIASNKAKKAAAVGVAATRYWVAFGVTLALTWVLSIVCYFTIGGPEGRLTRAQLEKSLVAGAALTDDNGFAINATDATCVAASVDSRGAGTYQCLIEFENGARQSYQVTADSHGRWVTSNGE
ncbi:hypothetical protein ACQP2X_19150 [Actinoplanes sp. CA-131856]